MPREVVKKTFSRYMSRFFTSKASFKKPKGSKYIKKTKKYTKSSSKSSSTHVVKKAPSSAPFSVRLLNLIERNPTSAAVFAGTTKCVAADVVIQMYFERERYEKEGFDFRRLAVFALFGSAYVGYAQYIFYSRIFSRVFPTANFYSTLPFREKLRHTQGLKHLAGQVIADMAFLSPFVYIPIFYMMKGTMLDNKTISQSLTQYKNNLHQDAPAMWSVWLPFAIVNYSCTPLHLRIVTYSAVGFVWAMIVSYYRAGKDRFENEEASKTLEGITDDTVLLIEEVDESAMELVPSVLPVAQKVM